jgi:pimeloyl-ACP methyl ester carboxylesterase
MKSDRGWQQITTIKQVEATTAGGIHCRGTQTSQSGETLVLTMGYGGSLRIWPQSFVETLATTYTVITYDNRGTGLSIVPSDPQEYTIKAMADDLYTVVDLLKVDAFHLLGYSMGGCITLQYAHDHGDQVKTLFLLSTTAGGAMYVKPLPEISRALANPEGSTLWDMYMSSFRLMYSTEALTNCEPALRAIFENSKDFATKPDGLKGHSNAFKNFDGTAYLTGLKMPTTILTGADDRLMPPGNSENLASAIPNATFVKLPNCEHAAHVQDEKQVITEIEQLCRRAASTRSVR